MKHSFLVCVSGTENQKKDKGSGRVYLRKETDLMERILGKEERNLMVRKERSLIGKERILMDQKENLMAQKGVNLIKRARTLMVQAERIM